MNKDLKTIDDALNSGTLNENDDFEFDSATVEIIYGAAERMAERMKFLHEANVTLQAVNSERLEKMSEMAAEIKDLKEERSAANGTFETMAKHIEFLETENDRLKKKETALLNDMLALVKSESMKRLERMKNLNREGRMSKDLEIKNPNIREYHTILGEIIEIENYHPNTLALQLQHIKEAAERMTQLIAFWCKAHAEEVARGDKAEEKIEFWKREFDLELAHAKHAEERIAEIECANKTHEADKCCAACRSHMGDMCEKGHWSECNDKDFFKWMDEKVMKCDDYKSKEVENKCLKS